MRFETIPTLSEWQRLSASWFQIRANKPKVVRIDNLIARYHQVMDMSKLNILMELKNAVVDWAADKIERDANSGRLQAMRALEEVVLRKLSERDRWSRHRYTKAVCIGYAVKAGDYDANRKAPTPVVRRSHELADMTTRCNEMIAAIRAAHQKYTAHVGLHRISADEDRKTLKIFMGPEFYFRGPYGAYSDIGLLSQIFEQMRAETGDNKYRDWLFVFGSAIFTTDAPKGGALMLENYALVQKGGPKNADNTHHDFYVAKEFPSHVDFKHPSVTDLQWYNPATSQARIGGQNKQAVTPQGARYDPVLSHERDLSGRVRVSELVGGTIFTMDGITFGLEVCRDHLVGRLANSQEKGKVQIQLVPSCGASIAHPACMAGGIVFNVDAWTPHAQFLVNLPGRQVAKVTGGTSASGQIVLFAAADIPYPGVNHGQAWTTATPQAVANKLNVSLGVLSGNVTPPPIPPRPVRR